MARSKNTERVLSDGYKFKKFDNEEQHKHNIKVMSTEWDEWRAEQGQSRRSQGKDSQKFGHC